MDDLQATIEATISTVVRRKDECDELKTLLVLFWEQLNAKEVPFSVHDSLAGRIGDFLQHCRNAADVDTDEAMLEDFTSIKADLQRETAQLAAASQKKGAGNFRRIVSKGFHRALSRSSTSQLNRSSSRAAAEEDHVEFIPFVDEPTLEYLQGLAKSLLERAEGAQFMQENSVVLANAGILMIEQLVGRTDLGTVFSTEMVNGLQKELLQIDAYLRRSKEIGRRMGIAQAGALQLEFRRLDQAIRDKTEAIGGYALEDAAATLRREEIINLGAEIRDAVFGLTFNIENCRGIATRATTIAARLQMGIRAGLSEEDARATGNLGTLKRTMSRALKYIQRSHALKARPSKAKQRALKSEGTFIEDAMSIASRLDLVLGMKDFNTRAAVVDATGAPTIPCDLPDVKNSLAAVQDLRKVYVNKGNCSELALMAKKIELLISKGDERKVSWPVAELAALAIAAGMAEVYVERSKQLAGKPTQVQEKIYYNERRKIEEELERLMGVGVLLKLLLDSGADLNVVVDEKASKAKFIALCKNCAERAEMFHMDHPAIIPLLEYTEMYRKAVDKGLRMGILDEADTDAAHVEDFTKANEIARGVLDLIEDSYVHRNDPQAVRNKTITTGAAKLLKELKRVSTYSGFALLFEEKTLKEMRMLSMADRGVRRRDGTVISQASLAAMNEGPSAALLARRQLGLVLSMELEDTEEELTLELVSCIKHNNIIGAVEVMQRPAMTSSIARFMLTDAGVKYAAPLCFGRAAELGDEKLVYMLLGAGIELDKGDPKFGRTAMHFAALEGHTGVVKMLAEAGANVDARSKLGQTPLHLAVGAGHYETVRWLVEEGRADVEASDDLSRRPLHVACGEGDLDIVEYLVTNAGADLESVAGSYYAMRPVFFAVPEGHLEVLRFLIDQGARPTATMALDETLVHQASEFGHVEILTYLASLGLPMDQPSGFDFKRPIHYAAQNNRVEAARYLVETVGVDKNARAKFDRTSLHLAVQRGRVAMVQYLAGVGCDALMVDYENQTAMDLVVKHLSQYERKERKRKQAQAPSGPSEEQRRAEEEDRAAYTEIREILTPYYPPPPPPPRGLQKVVQYFHRLDERTTLWLESDEVQDFIGRWNARAKRFERRLKGGRLWAKNRAQAVSQGVSRGVSRAASAARISRPPSAADLRRNQSEGTAPPRDAPASPASSDAPPSELVVHVAGAGAPEGPYQEAAGIPGMVPGPDSGFVVDRGAPSQVVAAGVRVQILEPGEAPARDRRATFTNATRTESEPHEARLLMNQPGSADSQTPAQRRSQQLPGGERTRKVGFS